MTAIYDPVVDEISAPFWEALRQGRLTYQHCPDCDNAWLPPRSECPRCWSPRVEWRDSEGLGTLLSWVVYHRSFHPALKDWVPYNVAIIRLAEGPTLYSSMTDPDELLAVDAPVHLVIREREGFAIPYFSLAGSADETVTNLVDN